MPGSKRRVKPWAWSLFTIFFHDNRGDGFLFGGWMSWKTVQGKGIPPFYPSPAPSYTRFLKLVFIFFSLWFYWWLLKDRAWAAWAAYLNTEMSCHLLSCDVSRVFCVGVVMQIYPLDLGTSYSVVLFIFISCVGSFTNEWELPYSVGIRISIQNSHRSSDDLGKWQ